MASLDMKGSYPLTTESVNEQVTKKSPGNYALGYVAEESFYVQYVGRADIDLNDRLHDWVKEKKHSKFRYSYATSPKAAFEKECHNWHDFKPKQNKNHPARPDNANWECPVCDTF